MSDIEPPGTYSRKMTRSESSTCDPTESAKPSLPLTDVPHDVGVVQAAQQLDLAVQGLELLLAGQRGRRGRYLVALGGLQVERGAGQRGGEGHAFNRHELPRLLIEGHEHVPVRACAYKVPWVPLDRA